MPGHLSSLLRKSLNTAVKSFIVQASVSSIAIISKIIISIVVLYSSFCPTVDYSYVNKFNLILSTKCFSVKWRLTKRRGAFALWRKWRHNTKHDDTQYDDTQHNVKQLYVNQHKSKQGTLSEGEALYGLHPH